MADVTVEQGTYIQFSGSGISPADPATSWFVNASPTPTIIAITMASVADTAARQSAIADLGENRAPTYSVYLSTDHTGETPVIGGTSELYWLPSNSATPANSNVAGNSGLDAAAPGGALGSITLAEFLEWAIPIGTLKHHDGVAVHNGPINLSFDPGSRFGQLLWVNNSGDVYEADNVEHHCIFVPNKGDVA